jgi:malonate decarboxylase gamma subunit
MKIESLLNDLFPAGHSVMEQNSLLSGFAICDQVEIAVLGTSDHLAVDAASALELAAFVLRVIREKPGASIVMLVDTKGQRLSKVEELLGLNGYLAHLVKCLELARRSGHRLISLVYAEAVSGGFLSFGLMADDIYALPDATIGVMNLPAMSRITKLPLDMLEELSVSSPSFAPGVDNFCRLGGIRSVWKQPYSAQLQKALGRKITFDDRRVEGLARQGRMLAGPVSHQVVSGQGSSA